MQQYFFYNTDRNSFSTSRFHILIANGFAASAGPYKYGENFRKLKQGDMLLMYENRVGVVATGEVSALWDGKRYQEPLYYTSDELHYLVPEEPFEYRIPVDWYMDMSDNPIKLDRIRSAFKSPGFIPRGTIQRIEKHHDNVVSLLNEEQAEVEKELRSVLPVAFDIGPPRRAVYTESRIVRDTKKAIAVKQSHNFRCQLCGETIILKNDKKYAEAHHLKPLGRPHNGPDSEDNLICVCPNHHTMLDYGAVELDREKLQHIDGHRINPEFIEYHNNIICALHSD